MTLLTEALANISLTSTFFIILPALCAIYTTLWIIYCRTLHPLAKVPGPFFASFTRLWYMYRIYAADMDRAQRALHKKHGPLVRIAPDEVSSADPAAIPLIYRDRDPLLKTDFYTIWGDPSISKHPDMFTCIDEKYHADIRRIVSPVYTMANILKNEEYIAKCTRLFLTRLGEFADSGEPFDLGVWVQYYTFDTVGELMFGKMFGFLEKREDHGNFIRSLETLLPLIVTGAVAPAYARPFIMGSGIFVPAALRAIKALGNIRNAALGAVSNRKKEVEDGIADRYDLLQQMLDIAREKGEKADYGENEVACHCWSNL
jgi:cytochrome P450